MLQPHDLPWDQKGKNTGGGFVQPVNGCPVLCGFPSTESLSITRSLAFENACKTPGKRTESVLGKMLMHFPDSQGLFQAGETIFLLTEQLLEAKWKGHVVCVFV